ncbi:MAG: hypothetical protein H0U75_10235 [Legionella sp.]|nr:hypothetical protein [Legionella sp.]
MSIINKENQDSIQSMIQKNPCGLCRKAGLPLCKGNHGKSGTNTGESHFSGHKDSDESVDLSAEKKQSVSYSSTSSDLFFDLERLGDTLLIISDSSRGILSIYLKPCSEERDESDAVSFLRFIRMAFNEFKLFCKQQGLNVENFACNSDPNELIIRLPSPKYYDAFIQSLVDKKLFPPHYLAQLQQLESEDPERLKSNFADKKENTTALSNKQKLIETDSIFNPSPFRTTLELKNESWK